MGAKVLRAGGNAVDAAVATAFAIGTVEPWMSGLGGGGVMLVYSAAEDRVHGIDFTMVAPAALDTADYPLAEGAGGDLFGWPAVVDDRNLRGALSIAVPGEVAGLAQALEHFGTRGWAESLAPAIGLAEQGMEADWYASLLIATAAGDLARDPVAAPTFLPDGVPPVSDWMGSAPCLHLGRLAQTLRQLAAEGPQSFYSGDLARRVAADVQAAGGRLSVEDLGRYAVGEPDPVTTDFAGATVHAPAGLTAGPTLVQALEHLGATTPRPGAPGADHFVAYARALRAAYGDRLATMGDGAPAPSCTTHISVIDADGNMVALTQTLLSLFGSKVMLPETGILMNNGIMWFDPRPGGPNSIAPGRRPLSNMCPAIMTGPASRVALGASGGRRILPAIFQIVAYLGECGMDLETAFHAPRIDVSGGDTVFCDRRLAPEILSALAAEFSVTPVTAGVYPVHFACPNAVQWQAERQSACAFIHSPWAQARAA